MAEDIERALAEAGRIASLPRQEFLACLTTENRRNYLKHEREHEKYSARLKKTIDDSEGGIDYSIVVG